MKKAMKTSEEFGKMSGTKLNKKKVNILVNDKGVEEKLKQEMPEVEATAFRKAMILVGGIVSTGQSQQTSHERVEKNWKMNEILEK